MIPRQSHSLKTPYYCTSSSQIWLLDKHSYTYIKRDEQQVRALERKGMTERHTDMYGHDVQTTATSCSHKFYTFKMAVPPPSNQCPWFCTPPPTSSPSSLYVLASANKRGKKTESVTPPQTCFRSHEADDGVSTPKALIRLASTGLLGREGLQWVFEDEQELGRR